MRFATNRALTGALSAALGFALIGSAGPAAGAPDVMDTTAKVAKKPTQTTDVALANQILTRWESVAVQAGKHSPEWREVLSNQLTKMDATVLRSLDAVAVGDSADPKAAYARFEQGLRSALMQSYVNSKSGAGYMKLGSTTNDLVFVPVVPCRIVDTRNASPVSGPIVVGAPRNFYFFDASFIGTYNWSTGQGGATTCPGTKFITLFGPAPTAAMITVGVVSPSAAGNWVIWGGASPIPNSTALNWSGPGQILTSTVVVPGGGRTGSGPGGTILDFAVAYNGPSGNAQFTADIVGYFTENIATALDCVPVTNSATVSTGTSAEVCTGTCTTGYTQTGGGCDWNFANGNLKSLGEDGPKVDQFTGGTGAWCCQGTNNAGADRTFNATNICCRVPGR